MISQNLSFPLNTLGYNSYEHQIKVHQDPGDNSYFFWSCQFFMTNHMPGYMGLQTDTSSDGKFLGRGVRVGMADALKAHHEHSNEMLAGISGKSIFLPYAWKEEISYTLSVCIIESESIGNWWQFSLKDHDSNTEHAIGKFLLPFEDGLSNEIITRTEYLGPGSRKYFPKSGAAEFLDPTMIPFEDGSKEPLEPSSSQFDRPSISGCKIKRGSKRFSSKHQVTGSVPPKQADSGILSLETVRIVFNHIKQHGLRRNKVLEY